MPKEHNTGVFNLETNAM